jgi:hypothetical protein
MYPKSEGESVVEDKLLVSLAPPVGRSDSLHIGCDSEFDKPDESNDDQLSPFISG